jgi:alcohol dehydrogenase class IV
MQFEFSTAAKIIFGAGKLNSIDTLIDGHGNQVLIVSGAPKEISDRLYILLDLAKVNQSFIKIENEPTIDVVRKVVELARRTSSNLVIGIGGGSALDTAKAAAALCTNPGDVTDYLEVIGLNKHLSFPTFNRNSHNFRYGI